MNREDMIRSVKYIIENNEDPRIAAVKVFDFWAVSPSYVLKENKPTHRDTGEVYK